MARSIHAVDLNYCHRVLEGLRVTGRVEAVEGACLVLDTDAGSCRHLLNGSGLFDGDALELLTADGWLIGHYRAVLHPETARARFDLHVRTADEALEHVGVWLPERALLRRPHR